MASDTDTGKIRAVSADTAYAPETSAARDAGDGSLRAVRDTRTASLRSRISATKSGRRPGLFKGRNPFSRLTVLIIGLNVAALIVLLVGSLWLNQYRDALISTKTESLQDEALLLARLLAETSLPKDVPNPQLDRRTAQEVLRRVLNDVQTRVRLFDNEGILITGTFQLKDEIVTRNLPDILEEEDRSWAPAPLQRIWEDSRIDILPPWSWIEDARSNTLNAELVSALNGEPATAVRMDEYDELVVSVTVPIRHVQAVQAVLTLEDGDIEPVIIEAQRALLRIFWLALTVSIASSLALTAFIAQPIRRLARAADQVRMGLNASVRRRIPNFGGRRDEIGQLATSLQAMTGALYDRIDAIESFAADVAHEIKNPLTSMRSAIETLDIAKDETARAKLLDIIKKDIHRIDRLITDISNASRLEAEIARERGEPIQLAAFLQEITNHYAAAGREGEPRVSFASPAPSDPFVVGAGQTLARVFQNIIDNAISFSPPDGEVRVSLHTEQSGDNSIAVIHIDDQGPGIPPENLESIFERFYTERPPGAEFGSNSGLGLSICKQIVEAHHGQVWAENQDGGGGARFVVTLPITRAHG